MSRRHLVTLILAITLLVCFGQAYAGTPLTTAFTYQGRVEKLGSALNDTADIEFSLWDALAGGNQIGLTVTDKTMAFLARTSSS